MQTFNCDLISYLKYRGHDPKQVLPNARKGEVIEQWCLYPLSFCNVSHKTGLPAQGMHPDEKNINLNIFGLRFFVFVIDDVSFK